MPLTPQELAKIKADLAKLEADQAKIQADQKQLEKDLATDDKPTVPGGGVNPPVTPPVISPVAPPPVVTPPVIPPVVPPVTPPVTPPPVVTPPVTPPPVTPPTKPPVPPPVIPPPVTPPPVTPPPVQPPPVTPPPVTPPPVITPPVVPPVESHAGSLTLWDGWSGVSSAFYSIALNLFWRTPGGDWDPQSLGTLSRDTGTMDATALARALQQNNVGIIMVPNSDAAWAGRTYGDTTKRPRFTATFTDGSTVNLDCTCSAELNPGTSSVVLSGDGGLWGAYPLAIQFDCRPLAGKTIAHAEMAMTRIGFSPTDLTAHLIIPPHDAWLPDPVPTTTLDAVKQLPDLVIAGDWQRDMSALLSEGQMSADTTFDIDPVMGRTATFHFGPGQYEPISMMNRQTTHGKQTIKKARVGGWLVVDAGTTQQGQKMFMGLAGRGGCPSGSGYLTPQCGNGGNSTTGLKTGDCTCGWSMRPWLTPRADDALNPMAQYRVMQTYAYWAKMPVIDSPYGQTFMWACVFEVGKKYWIEQEIVMNTVSGPLDASGNGTGNNDGTYKVWVNGVPVDIIDYRTHVPVANWCWTNNDAIGIDELPWVDLYEGGVDDPKTNTYVKLGAFAVTQGSPIGVMSVPNPAALAPEPPSYEGSHDATDCTRLASGWARDKANPTRTQSVDIYVDGALSSTVTCTQPRGDLTAAHIGDRAFNVVMPEALKDGHQHAVKVCYAGTQQTLWSSPRSFTCGVLTTPIPTGGGTGATTVNPLWKQAAPRLTWWQIPNTALVNADMSALIALGYNSNDLYGSPNNRILDYSGACMAGTRKKLYGGGGAGANAANLCWDIDYAADAPRYTVGFPPCPASAVPPRDGSGATLRWTNFDGTPIAIHSYKGVWWWHGKLYVVFQQNGWVYDGGRNGDIWCRDANGWAKVATLTDRGGGGWDGPGMCQHPTTGRIYIALGDRIEYFDPNDNSTGIQWWEPNRYGGLDGTCMTVMNNKIYMIGASGSDGLTWLWQVDINSGASTRVMVTAFPSCTPWKINGSLENDGSRLLGFVDDGNIYVIGLDGSCTPLVLGAAPPQIGHSISKHGDGPKTRFRYVPELGGILLTQASDVNTYFVGLA